MPASAFEVLKLKARTTVPSQLSLSPLKAQQHSQGHEPIFL